ncbi:lipocalin family protein [Sulfuricurvum sp.]|uniref:lipocalin family protein n=1 Tax=Sulfuricurvum sp. TaxID=2025608 RepID=UPI00260FF600|nr:lipocalin family protein [Sulfuricurvum sp.]MDD3598401.1 lipocalin family protein [Sulfuricurvum sp.]
MFTKKLTVACIVLASSLNANSLSNCENLVGSWKGSYLYPANGVTNEYQVTFNNDHSSSEVMSLKAPDNSLMKHRQQGTWTCDGNEFSITVPTQTGVKVSNHYRVMEMTSDHQKFQHYHKGNAGPIFDLRRTK